MIPPATENITTEIQSTDPSQESDGETDKHSDDNGRPLEFESKNTDELVDCIYLVQEGDSFLLIVKYMELFEYGKKFEEYVPQVDCITENCNWTICSTDENSTNCYKNEDTSYVINAGDELVFNNVKRDICISVGKVY